VYRSNISGERKEGERGPASAHKFVALKRVEKRSLQDLPHVRRAGSHEFGKSPEKGCNCNYLQIGRVSGGGDSRNDGIRRLLYN